jgi:hypothetical protein
MLGGIELIIWSAWPLKLSMSRKHVPKTVLSLILLKELDLRGNKVDTQSVEVPAQVLLVKDWS